MDLNVCAQSLTFDAMGIHAIGWGRTSHPILAGGYPAGSVNGLTDGMLSGRGGDGFPRVLEAGDALLDARREFRSVAL